VSEDTVFPRIRPEIAALPAYRQGRQASADAFKLSSNENPFEPLPGVVEAVQAATAINRYPDATAARLRERLAARHGVTPDEVHVGAGSVSLLAQLLLAVAGPGDEVVYAWRSFEAYPSLVAVTGATSVQVPLTAAFRHDLPAMAAAITERTRLVVVCSPNNPTGPTVAHDDFAAFVDAVPRDVLIVLDEAYAEFVTDASSVSGDRVRGILNRPNIVVLRTFSKAYGLAGLRVGYAVGHTRVLDAARSTAIPLAVTAAAEVAALASLEAESELLERVSVIAERRDRLVARLRDTGWDVPDAQGNFVWLPAGDRALDVAAAFEEAGLVVRPFAGDGVRVSVGEEEAVDAIVATASAHAPDVGRAASDTAASR